MSKNGMPSTYQGTINIFRDMYARMHRLELEQQHISIYI